MAVYELKQAWLVESYGSTARLFFPRHVGEFCGGLNGLRFGCAGHFEFGIFIDNWAGGGRGVGLVHIAAPGSDARLQSVMFGGLFVAGPHVVEGEIGVDELFVRSEVFGFVAFGDGFGIMALSIQGHAEGELGIEVDGVFCQ